MKTIIGLLLIFYSLTIGVGLAESVDLKTAPMEENIPSLPVKNKQNFNIGQRDTEKEKPQGVWVDLYLQKNIAVGCGLNINFYEPDLQNRQNRNSGKSGLGATLLGGSVGLKFLFK